MKHPDRFDFSRSPRTAYEEIVAQATRIEERLTSAGIPTVKCSRLSKYRRIVESFVTSTADSQPNGEFDWVLLHQALCEIAQIHVIVDQLLTSPSSQSWLSPITKLVSGHTLPQTERDQSRARDFQFELLVAARCRAAGYAVESREPDILVRDANNEFSIAAKRPKSPKKLDDHIRKASKQIQRSGVAGLVAVDLSLIHNPANGIQLIKRPEEGLEAVQRVANHFVEWNSRRIRSLVHVADVFGFVVCMNGLFFVQSTLQFSQATRWTISNLCELSDARYYRLRDFSVRFAQGI